MIKTTRRRCSSIQPHNLWDFSLICVCRNWFVHIITLSHILSWWNWQIPFLCVKCLAIELQIPAWPATRGVPAGTPFLYPEDIAMAKPFLTFQAQISFLEQDKNLLVENRTFAEAMLTQSLRSFASFSRKIKNTVRLVWLCPYLSLEFCWLI